MVTKKIRTEYMKKFKDPRWETFSKCYEDSLKYRLTRRVMEHSHKPWFWEGWDSGSDSSGWSTPRLIRNKVAPLSLPPPPTSSELKQRLCELRTSPGPEPPSEEAEPGAGEAGDAAPNTAALVENGVNEAGEGSVKPVPNTSSPSEDTATDNGPADTASSDGEPVNPLPKRRHRRRTPHTEPGRRDSSTDDKQAVVRKAPRAKSQPPISTKENRRPSSRLDWTERRTEVRTTTNDSQTRRESDKRSNNVERRRARSADLDKVRRSQLTVVDDRWMTEYMSCFSARLR
ncbi:centriole, cilia and spindle-associated protein [Hippoglossus hippoglossus]|uniref:centriole, cilia and spindle-associated protein n=1 Tax=Hippoglossus hippoglossus TaxID=8267 RepID=UPI00148E522D|nr:centriole, cilia and spindle-associated protein [Hippoglossus hippoglossus]XP_034446087.1 centriole, cilia and spindle-associated protein [Hippoglossus hippoglossus]XP_034999500.1 centriole, cilia and spindle-associated protein [Hippoglossus stenolepis]XP_034999509.1 centriole, cilia and spindle-associated protein [Hippoglossus stenolepis]XP_034999517.1 centriole, cilia and spindle-associated protein [Hippoglossus stenolepis]